jgi:hypothetical protein
MSRRRPARATLACESLEERSLPSSTPLLIEPFQPTAGGGLPSGWVQWSANGSTAFRTDGTAGLGGVGELVGSAPTGVASRAWVAGAYPADAEASASVYLNSLDPVQLFLRGRGLDGTSPTYYAASVVRGGKVDLVRVINGREAVIGSVRSGDYVSNQWVQVSIRAEANVLTVQVRRTDTGRYLDPSGNWVSEPANAILVRDSAIASEGRVGFNRGSLNADRLAVDALYVNRIYPESRELYQVERFDTEANGALPDGWASWGSAGTVAARTTLDQTLRVGGGSADATRLWIDRLLPVDIQATSSVYLDGLAPAQLFARGSGLNTARPTYYALSITRGATVQLLRVVNGQATVLGTVRSADYVSGQWVQVSLVARGSEIRAQVFRTDTAQYLRPDGTWGLTPGWALARTDTAITSGRNAGLGRGAGAPAEVTFDNFVVSSAPTRWDEVSPIPTQGDKATPLPTPPTDSGPTPPVTPPTGGTTTGGLPGVPQHLDWIRLAELAYYGTPLDAFAQARLRDSVDLVIPNQAYLGTIAATAPGTPQFVYTNVSNVYLGLLTDWLAYADQHHLSRESAFYHVTRATPYSGASASSVPVNNFWGVYVGRDGSWTDRTASARNAGDSFALGGAGTSLAIGYTEKFREINVSLRSAAANGWTGVLEYATAVDAQGRPTAWAALRTLSDATGGLRRSGTITFDPPANWVASSVNGSARLYYVRVRTTSGGTAPVVTTLLGRDYTNSRGGNSGTTPAFDYAADKNGDGYLSDAEYAARRAGFDARFAYEGRVFYPNYGPNRFATNVSDPAFRAWAVDYLRRAAAGLPQAAGFFIDNSPARLAVDPGQVREGMGNYSADYGTLLGAINTALAPRWVIANTSGGGQSADGIAKARVSYLEEFGLRPMTANSVQFEDLWATLLSRRQLSGGKSYEILDSLPTAGFDATNPRVQIATLAMYYLLADPNLSFLLMNGGNEPASSWSRHWTDAIKFDVGKPAGTWSVFASGQDPSNRALDYKVYEREYQNALVLYKPVSYSRGVNGTTADNTATTHYLGGTYREVRADGTLGPAITKITLRNGEGAVLARVK